MLRRELLRIPYSTRTIGQRDTIYNIYFTFIAQSSIQMRFFFSPKLIHMIRTRSDTVRIMSVHIKATNQWM